MPSTEQRDLRSLLRDRQIVNNMDRYNPDKTWLDRTTRTIVPARPQLQEVSAWNYASAHSHPKMLGIGEHISIVGLPQTGQRGSMTGC